MTLLNLLTNLRPHRLPGAARLLFLLALALSTAHASAAVEWHYNSYGRGICEAVYQDTTPEAVMQAWEGCQAAYANKRDNPGYSYSVSLKSCTMTSTPGWSQAGVAQCVEEWRATDSGGNTMVYTDQAPIVTCPTSQVYWHTPGDPDSWWSCVSYLDTWHYCPFCGQPRYGNPILPLSGAKTQSQALGVTLAGQPLTLTYDTSMALPVDQGTWNLVAQLPPAFGPRWTSSMHGALYHEAATGGGLMVRDGRVTSMTQAGKVGCSSGGSANQYLGTTDRNLSMSFDANGAQAPATLVDGAAAVVEAYDGLGNLSKRTNARGGWLSYTYSTTAVPGIAPTAGLLLTVSDHLGRSVQFTYEQPAANVDPRVNTMTAPDGAVTRFGYDANGNLQAITWPDLQVLTYRYERADLPWALTGITDELGRVHSSYDYDAAGRATSTQLAGQVARFGAEYTAAPPQWQVTETAAGNLVCRDHHQMPPGPVRMTDPAGTTTMVVATSADGMVRMASEDVPAGSGSAASARNYAYDAHGNLTDSLDANGNRTCYGYDTTRDLRTQSLEGLPQAKACPATLAPAPVDAGHPERLTTTQWHPDWALKSREARPLNITTWVYNGQPDPVSGGTAACAATASALPNGKPISVLCKRYEQATDDADGSKGFSPATIKATRAWSYTYDANGQVLTAVSPKRVSTDPDSQYTTTYVYFADTSFPDGVTGHTVGDLQSVADPLGFTTQYQSYDKAGRLLSSTDANNVVTTQSYWPRGWLRTRTVTTAQGTALKTSYDYYPTGLLKLVTQPDGTTLAYQYDDAHRLTDVTDGAGNTVHYVLDGQGNRTGETVQDSTGKLASAIARVYDSLNRLQAVTGAAQ
jgi:YD repeat-containing protein